MSDRIMSLVALILIVLASAAAAPAAEGYLSKPVRLVVNFPAGGPADVIARTIAQKVTEIAGQQMIVDFRGGAAGTIGADHVAKSPPDGFTILLISSSFLTNPAITAKLPFDPVADFTPITPAATSSITLVANPVLPVRLVRELIAIAKKHPGKLTFGSSGTGGSLHLGGELLKFMAGIDMLHVPYKGAALALIEVVGGQVDMMFIALPQTLPHIKNGRLRALGVGGAKRAASLPDVPTIAESGVPGFELSSHFGILGPAGIPAEIVNKLNMTLLQALQSADLKERMVGSGLEPMHSTPEQYALYVKSEIAKWAKVVKLAGLRPE